MSDLIAKYLSGRREPWSEGYGKYKNKLLNETFNDADMMRRFREGAPLPQGFGSRIDERCVEYPWVLARLAETPGRVLDAGSTLSAENILRAPQVAGREILIYTLMTDWITLDPKISYIFGDFREMMLRDRIVDAVVCISTLEHVGMGQDYKKYNTTNLPLDFDLYAYRHAMFELHRVMAPGAKLFLTLPFGVKENHGWLQQFDREGIRDVIAAFPGTCTAETYYLYSADGWQVSSAEEAAGAKYFNIHAANGFDPDYAAAARSVACLELTRI